MENLLLIVKTIINKIKGSTRDLYMSVFVAEISWHESRRKWIGDPTQRSKSVPKDPIIRYCL